MKKYLLLLILCCFTIPSLLSAAPSLSWHTFAGGADDDTPYDVHIDSNGDIIVTGYSSDTWGTPINAFSSAGATDLFVAKFDNSGTLLWNTFFGGAATNEYGYKVTTDNTGSIYVTGNGENFGTPLNPHAGAQDIIVLKLNNSGVYQWHTFHGGAGNDYSYGIEVASDGDIYLGGYSSATWGTPQNAHAGGSNDIVVTKLNSSGVYQWHTFIGGGGNDRSLAMTVDASENIYTLASSDATWGTPVNAYSANERMNVSKLNSSGVLQWNTFHGGAFSDSGRDIIVDASGNVYFTGYSAGTWGTPLNPHAGLNDIFAAQLNSVGALQWNTFFGGAGTDRGYSIDFDLNGNLFLSGYSNAPWGSPVDAYAGATYAYNIIKVTNSGNLLWNTFLASSSFLYTTSLDCDNLGNIAITGLEYDTWGTPINPKSGFGDVELLYYNDDSASIPTFTEWAAIIFGVSLLFIGVWYIRKMI